MASRKKKYNVGDVIDGYRLTAKCGEGGFGQVFLAENTISGHLLALKILFDVKAKNKELDGLKAFQGCRNEHLIQIHHIGKTDNGYLYYTMDRADNAGTESRYEADSLDRRIKKGKLSPEEVFDLAVHLAEALGCLHDAGLIHRDIKPANIIYVGGKPVLADIGLVTKSKRPNVSFAGTPGFLPKYVYYGGHPPCRESDFYSLGMVLWCALTGHCDPEEARTANGTMTLSGHSGDLQRLCMAIQDEQDYDKITIHSSKDFLGLLNSEKDSPSESMDSLVKDELYNSSMRDRNFFGRINELKKLHQLLNPVAGQQKKIPLLLGTSGIGKTGLALQYGKIFHPSEYPEECILLNAGSGGKKLSEIFSIFWSNPINKQKYEFEIPDEIKKPDEKFELLIWHLSDKGRRILFILDNLSEDLQLNAEILDHFKTYRECCIDLIATATVCRFTVTPDDPVEIISIEGLTEKDGIELLRHKHAIESPEELLAAGEIVRYLGGNAWALDVVGETLKQEPEKFPDDYREKWKELQAMPLQALTSDSNMVRIGHGGEINPELLLKPVLDHLSPDELEIAQAAACCAPEYIHPAWLQGFYEQQHGVKFADEKQWRRKKIISSLKQRNILLGADNINLHDSMKETSYLRMHRLTRLIICNMYKEEISRIEGTLIKVISMAEFENDRLGLIAAGHLLVNVSSAETDLLELLASDKVNLLDLLLRYDQYSLAEELISAFLKKINDCGTDAEHSKYRIRLLKSRMKINIVAKQDYKQALADIESVCDLQKGNLNADYCSSLCSKANVYMWLKQLDRAAICLGAAYNIIIQCNLLNTKVHAWFLSRSAVLDNWLEKYESAEEKLLTALSIRKKLSTSQFEIIYTIHLLGDCCRYQNKIEKSLDYYNQSEKFYLDSLGEKNLSTAKVFSDKAKLLRSCKDYQAACSYLLKAMHVHEEILGPKHTFTLNDYLDLYKLYDLLHDTEKADFYRSKVSVYKDWRTARERAITLSRLLGQHQFAEQKLLKILKEQNELYNYNSEEISFTLFYLSEVQIAQRNYNEALESIEKAYKMLKRCTPHNTSWDRWYYSNLSNIYKGLNQTDKGIFYAEKALAVEQARIPCDHINLAVAYNNLAVAYRDAALFSKAEELHKEALKLYTENDMNLATMRTAYARTLIELRHFDEALQMEELSLRFRLTTLPSNHEHIAINYHDMGRIFIGIGNIEKAKDVLNKALLITTSEGYEGKEITKELISHLLAKC